MTGLRGGIAILIACCATLAAQQAPELVAD
jgi:hypothetical protein